MNAIATASTPSARNTASAAVTSSGASGAWIVPSARTRPPTGIRRRRGTSGAAVGQGRLDRLQHTVLRCAGRGQLLADEHRTGDVVPDDEVGERPPDVHADPQALRSRAHCGGNGTRDTAGV